MICHGNFLFGARGNGYGAGWKYFDCLGVTRNRLLLFE